MTVRLCPRGPISINSSVRPRNYSGVSHFSAVSGMRSARRQGSGFDSWDALRKHVESISGSISARDDQTGRP